MRNYSAFAQYYDALTDNVEYEKRCDYILELFKRNGAQPKLVLDLACGTGSLSITLAKRGFDVIGVDASEDMLSVAQQKAAEEGESILFLCQKMQKLDLYGTIDAAICTLDSINHLLADKDVIEAFKKVSLFLNPNGYFIFDVNTEYKHRCVLGNNTFVYDTESVFCVWQNEYDEKKNSTTIKLDFFELIDGVYERSSESFAERAYSIENLTKWLQKAGLEVVGIFDEMTFSEPAETSERVFFVAKKA